VLRGLEILGNDEPDGGRVGARKFRQHRAAGGRTDPGDLDAGLLGHFERRKGKEKAKAPAKANDAPGEAA
jgi:hypothetical protein